ncbi:MAG: GntR family transcriptional regulator [Burkholderiaceae bacterium]|nr:GntR family transcriptional regulator [Burkholderiaceae bacterium]
MPIHGQNCIQLMTDLNSRSRQVERVVLRLRQYILEGRFAPGEHLAEIPLSAMLGMSRTPVRSALAVLEREGLLVSAPRRGYCVREITVDQILDAFEVRGALEALACRLALERGLPAQTIAALRECMEEGESLLAVGRFDEAGATAWGAMNSRFHAEIVNAANNQPLEDALEHNARLPMVAAGAIAFHAGNLDAAFELMKRAFEEHVDILDALLRGQAGRAEALVREHAYKSRRNLEVALKEVRATPSRRDVARIPGLKLIVG